MGQRVIEQSPEAEGNRQVPAEKMIERLEMHRTELSRQLDMVTILLEQSEEREKQMLVRIAELEGKY